MLDVTIHISVPADGGLTETEAAILRALGGNVETVAEPAPAPAEEPKAAPAKAAAKKAAPPKKAEPKPEPAAAEEPTELDEEGKKALATERATGFINRGEADKLRTVLTDLGVRRVSELEGENLDSFLAETA